MLGVYTPQHKIDEQILNKVEKFTSIEILVNPFFEEDFCQLARLVRKIDENKQDKVCKFIILEIAGILICRKFNNKKIFASNLLFLILRKRLIDLLDQDHRERAFLHADHQDSLLKEIKQINIMLDKLEERGEVGDYLDLGKEKEKEILAQVEWAFWNL